MKRLLIVVDFQNDFVEGSLAFSKAKDLEEVIYQKILDYQKNEDEIIFTLDTHQENYLETVEGKKLPIVHCLKGSSGHQLYGRIKDIGEKYRVFEKETFPSFALAKYLESKEYESVELCGLVSNICVLSNAIMVKSVIPNTEIIVDAQATASFNEDLNQKSLDIMEGLHINIINRSS